jgi:hypothetical protein
MEKNYGFSLDMHQITQLISCYGHSVAAIEKIVGQRHNGRILASFFYLFED